MWNQVVEYVREQRMLDKGDRVIVGVSGGADSVCLLFLLKELQHLYDLELHVVHINHGLRGEEANAILFIHSGCITQRCMESTAFNHAA